MNWLALLLRNRGVRMAGFVITPLLFAVWWQFGGAPGDVVQQDDVGGDVTAIYQHAYLVTLDDGQRVRVFRSRHVEPGRRVQLHVSRFESGVTYFVGSRDSTVRR